MTNKQCEELWLEIAVLIAVAVASAAKLLWKAARGAWHRYGTRA